MPAAKSSSEPIGAAVPLTIEQLEMGAHFLNAGADRDSFWEANVGAFRQTVLVAIRETADALVSTCMTERWRAELERQATALRRYMEFADDYLAQQARHSTLN